MNWKTSVAWLGALFSGAFFLCAADAPISVLVVTDDPAPDGNGRFGNSFESPSINDSGQVAFSAGLKSTLGGARDNRGIFRADGPRRIVQIARGGQPAPGNNGVLKSGKSNMSFMPLINEGGAVAFWVGLSGTTGGSTDNEGVFLGKGDGLLQIVRKGQPTPEGEGKFWLNGSMVGGGFTLNASNQVAFTSSLDAEVFTTEGVYRSDGVQVVELARVGQPAPKGLGTYSFMEYVSVINNRGEVLFLSMVSNDLEPVSRSAGFLSDGVSPARLVFAEGDTSPANDGAFSLFSSLDLNESGQILFGGQTEVPGPCCTNYHGLFRLTGNSVAQIARHGQVAPDGNGVLDIVFGYPCINNAGQVIFFDRLSETIAGKKDNDGLFVGDGGVLRQIVRDGQSAPDGNGRFDYIDDFGSTGDYFLNDDGQVAFLWPLSGTLEGEGDNVGVFFSDDDHGLLQVVRTGQLLLGSRIVKLSIAGRWGGAGVTALNNRGQIAFAFELSDGREGIAVWSPPVVPQRVRLRSRYESEAGSVIFSWPATSGDWVLEVTSTPEDPQSWRPTTVAPVTVGAVLEFRTATEGPRRLFRLRRASAP